MLNRMRKIVYIYNNVYLCTPDFTNQYHITMKNLLLTLIFLCGFSALYAADGITLGYCNGQVVRQGKVTVDGEATVSAAILLTADMLAPYVGNSVAAIRVGLAARTNIDKVSVWVRQSLDGTDLASATITTDAGEIERGWNEIDLAQPYDIVANQPLYIGYTYEQRGTSSAISLIDGTTAGAFFFKESATSAWADRANEGILSVEAVIVGDNIVTYDMEMLSAEGSYDNSGNIVLTTTLHNSGAKDIEGFQLTTTIGDQMEQINTTFTNLITKGETTTLNFTISPTTADAGRKHKLTLALTELASGNVTDEVPENDALQVTMTYPRKVLIEEFTGEKCTNCPRAAKFLHEVLAQGEFATTTVMTAHHSGYLPDWLTFRPTDIDYEWFYNHTTQIYAPAMMVDRYPYEETSEGTTYYTPCFNPGTTALIIERLSEALQRKTNAYINAEATLTADKTGLNVTINGGRTSAEVNYPSRLTVFIVEDHIPQRNQVSLDTYPEFEHMGVLRAVNDTWGEPIQWTGDEFNATYTFNFDADWEQENLRVVAFISDYDANDPAKCVVHNCEQVTMTDVMAAVNTAETKAQVESETYYSIDGKQISNPQQKGILLQRQKLTDGTVVVRKIKN